jgi:hypothetical protein
LTGSLLFTLFSEGLVVLGYAAWRKKAAGRLLLASVFVNVGTQSLLWLALNLFPDHYLATLAAAEPLIWLAESAWLYRVPGTRLTGREALLLSLVMNLASFGLGWFLAV